MRAYPENNTSAALLAAIAVEGTNDAERAALRDALLVSIAQAATASNVNTARDSIQADIATIPKTAPAILTDAAVGLAAIQASVEKLLTDSAAGQASISNLVGAVSGVVPRTLVMMTENAAGTAPTGYKRYSGNVAGISQTPIKIEACAALGTTALSDLTYCTQRIYALSSGGTATGLVYDITNRSVTSFTSSSVPANGLSTQMGSMTIAATTSAVYAAGGGTSPAISVRKLTPATNAWASVANMPSSRTNATLVASPLSEVLFAVGGSNGGAEYLAIDRYTESSNTWTAAVATFAPGIGASKPFILKLGSGNVLISFSTTLNYLFNVTSYALTLVDSFPGTRPGLLNMIPVRTATGGAVVLVGAGVLNSGKRCAVFAENAAAGAQWTEVEAYNVGLGGTQAAYMTAYSAPLPDGATYSCVAYNGSPCAGLTAYSQFDASGRISYFEKT